MNPLEELRIVATIQRVVADTEPLTVNLDIGSAWKIVAAVQLASRHPSITPEQLARLREVTRPFEYAITTRHPEAAALLAQGWDARFDTGGA